MIISKVYLGSFSIAGDRIDLLLKNKSIGYKKFNLLNNVEYVRKNKHQKRIMAGD